jgi:hypothetical protein
MGGSLRGICLLTCFLAMTSIGSASHTGIINRKVQRILSMKANNVYIDTVIEIENEDVKEATSYLFAVNATYVDDLAFIRGSIATPNMEATDEEDSSMLYYLEESKRLKPEDHPLTKDRR